jgi:hypothetical protein
MLCQSHALDFRSKCLDLSNMMKTLETKKFEDGAMFNYMEVRNYVSG